MAAVDEDAEYDVDDGTHDISQSQDLQDEPYLGGNSPGQETNQFLAEDQLLQEDEDMKCVSPTDTQSLHSLT